MEECRENFKSIAIFCDCPARFVLDLVGIPEDRFSDVAAHIYHDSLKCSSHSIKNNTILSKCLEKYLFSPKIMSPKRNKITA